jgi:nucleotide-binding universal stress UspA family protein
MRIILVPVDLSEISDAVIEQARCFARTQASHLHLLHVAPPAPDITPFNVDRLILRQQAARRLRDLRLRLRGYADQLRHERVDVSTRFTRGTVNTAILAEAQRIAADLIIIGSHNHGNIYHAIFGGVGQKVMRNAPCPVMLVPFRCPKPVWRPLQSRSGAETEHRAHH